MGVTPEAVALGPHRLDPGADQVETILDGIGDGLIYEMQWLPSQATTAAVSALLGSCVDSFLNGTTSAIEMCAIANATGWRRRPRA